MSDRTKSRMWMVRAGRGGAWADEFVQDQYVGVGWREVGDPTGVRDKQELVTKFDAAYPEASEQSRFVSASILYRFLKELGVGDDVITYDPAKRLYHIGSVIGLPIWAEDGDDERSTRRKVSWRAAIARDNLSIGARNTLGATLTFFLIPFEIASEINAGGVASSDSGASITKNAVVIDSVIADPFQNIGELAHERIKDRLSGLDWQAMQELIAALLRAIGYRTTVSPHGADRGKDIFASRDGFGFEQPRIVVEVKHRVGTAMGAPDVRGFLGGRHKDDRGLYVSTGGFTREAYYEAERATIPLTLMTLEELARAIVDNYDRFDDRGRSILPLTRVYWPA